MWSLVGVFVTVLLFLRKGAILVACGKAKPHAARWGAVAQLAGLVARLPAVHVPGLSASPAFEGSIKTGDAFSSVFAAGFWEVI